MGAWGYLPKNSDGAHDLFFKINNCVNVELENIIADKNTGYHYAGLIMILLQSGFFIKHKFITKAYEYIKDELEGVNNGNYKSGWKDPEIAKEKIGHVLQGFDVLLEKNKNFYLTTNMLGGKDISKRTLKWRLKKLDESTIFAPNGWLDIDEIESLKRSIEEDIFEEKVFTKEKFEAVGVLVNTPEDRKDKVVKAINLANEAMIEDMAHTTNNLFDTMSIPIIIKIVNVVDVPDEDILRLYNEIRIKSKTLDEIVEEKINYYKNK